jgi:hypothetical protein
MTATFTTAAVTAKLTALEQQAQTQGWDAMPVLYALFDQSQSPLGIHHTVEADGLPIDESVWHLHQHTPRLRLPYWIGLEAITDRLVSPQAPPWVPDWLHRQPHRTLIGFAFLQEGLDTSALHDEPQAEPIQVRAVTGCDVNGSFYEILREPAAEPTVTVVTNPRPELTAKVITACLNRLVAAYHLPPGDPHAQADAGEVR